jgi:poly(A) polymerase
MLDNYEFLLAKREEFANEPIIPPPLVRGDDLIALGLKSGPKFGGFWKLWKRDSWKGRFAAARKRSNG